MQLKELEFSSKDKVIICTVRRGEDVFIPSGDFTILEGILSILQDQRKQYINFTIKLKKAI